LEEQDVIEAVLDEEEVETVEDEDESAEEEAEKESVSELMAFNGLITAENESGFSLQNATVSVSTLLALFVMAMTVWMLRSCFWKLYGTKVAKGSDVNYGAIENSV